MGGAAVTRQDVRRWWTAHPMAYDRGRPIAAPPGSPEYLDETERRFLGECWFAQPPGAAPFSGLIDFAALEGRDVLEVGCGPGVHARLLAGAGARLTALDLTATAARTTACRLARHGLRGHVLHADGEALPFPDRSFDFVWSWGVVQHSADSTALVREMTRVLRPGGRVSLMVYHRRSLTYWAQFMLMRGVLQGWLLREPPEAVASRWSDGAVARHFTRGEVRALLAPAFADVRTEVFGQMGESVPLPAAWRRHVAPLLPEAPRRALLRRVGWLLFATAVRR